jgi:hypothetical protein
MGAYVSRVHYRNLIHQHKYPLFHAKKAIAKWKREKKNKGSIS